MIAQFNWRKPTAEDLGMLNVVRLAGPIPVGNIMALTLGDFRPYLAADCMVGGPGGFVLSERGKQVLRDAGWPSEPDEPRALTEGKPK